MSERTNFDGRDPLENPCHERLAQFLATPDSLKEFDSNAALADDLKVSRMTVYRWGQNPEVLRRVEWLLMQNSRTGKLIIRRELPEIIEKLIEKAKGGDVKAIKECLNLGYLEDKQRNKSGLSSRSLEEVLERAEIEHEKHAEMMTPTWMRERQERRKAAEREGAEATRPPDESEDKPD